MNITIFKYPLPWAKRYVDLEMPVGAKPLHVGEQEKTLCLWALVNSDNVKARYRVTVFCTGDGFRLSPDQEYVGSVSLFNGEVVHVFFQSLL